jgi:3-hydroxyisobutyrate dehydrogenase
MTRSVAVLGGGGTMGFPMARNIARAGIEVRAWDRTRQKAEPLAEDGVTVADTAAEAADGASVILTMLPDADAVIQTMQGEDGGLARAAESTIWLQMSTVGEDGIERCAELASERRVRLVDAPVSGTKQPAEKGELLVMASGPSDARDEVTPIFDAVGQRTMWLGDAGEGTRLKLVTNSWLLTVVEGAAETIAIAQDLELDPKLFLEAVAGGPLDLPYLQMKGKAMIERDFEPSFALRLAAKDAGLVEQSLDRRGLDLPLPRVIRERLDQAARDHGDEDVSATYLVSAPQKTAA